MNTRVLTGLALCFVACAHTAARDDEPTRAARSYAASLREGRIDDAFASCVGLEASAFRARYQDVQARERRAGEVEAQLAGNGNGLELVLEQGRWRVREGSAAAPGLEAQAKQTLDAFAAAVESRDFARALSLMAAGWRGRYTAQRLADDFSNEPLAKERLIRAKTAAGGPWVAAGAGVTASVGAGKAVRLVREGETLKVESLE